MRRPAKPFSQRGLLLVEAVLAAVVIVVGLVFVSRSLSSQLRALQSVEEYDTLASLAQGKLQELEAKRLAGRSLDEQDRQGTFEPPYAMYQWAVSARVRPEPSDPAGAPLAKDVILSVQRTDRPATAFQLAAVWPVPWIPDTWR